VSVYEPISGLTALAEAGIKGDDLAVLVDVHDTTQALTGSTKKATLADLRTAIFAGSNGAFGATDDLNARNAAFSGTLGVNGIVYAWPASQVANGFLKTDGSGNLTWVSEHSAISLAQLSDVSLTSPASGQWLGYAGGLWVNHTPVTADITDLTTAATGITQVGTIGTGVWNATAIAWAKVDKTGSSLADLTTRSAADLTSGVLADGRVQQSNVTQYQAALAIAYTQLTYSALTAGQVLRATGAAAAAFGALDLANASAITGSLPYGNLPTGSSSWDTGVGTTITITRSLTVSGTLTGALTGNASTATALQTARTIGGVSFDGTAPITVSTATAGFTVSGGDLALGANNLTLTGSIGATGARALNGWFTDLQVTNAITGSITGNAATADKWSSARSLAGNSVDGSAAVAFANKFIVQGTVDAGLSGAQFLGALGTGIVKNTTTTGVLSIAVAGDFPTLNQNTTGSAATLTTPRAINGVNFDGSAPITVAAAAGTLTGSTLAAGVTASSLTSLGTLTSLTVVGALSFTGSVTQTAAVSSPQYQLIGLTSAGNCTYRMLNSSATAPYDWIMRGIAADGTWQLIDNSGGFGAVVTFSKTTGAVTLAGPVTAAAAFAHTGSTFGIYGTAPIAKQTGVAVTAAAIHAACVALGFFSA
jgi:hypothetical protein